LSVVYGIKIVFTCSQRGPHHRHVRQFSRVNTCSQGVHGVFTQPSLCRGRFGRWEVSPMAADTLLPDPVRQAPATATAVYLVLDRDGPLTYPALVEELGASRSAVEMAIADLQEHDLVDATPDATEPCQKRWDTVG